MILINNNISPLPFYDDISLQNHRKEYAFGQIYPLVTYSNFLLPFQFLVPKKFVSIRAVKLIDYNTGNDIDITTSLKNNGLILDKTHDSFNVVKYPGVLAIPEIKHEGFYYLEIQASGNVAIFYSEVFSITNDISNCIELRYASSHNFELKKGIVDFSDNFYFKCYLHTQIGKPEYTFEEEVTERMGYSFIESQVSKKIYRFTVLAPEYLCDALRIVRLCDNKRIKSGKHIYDLTTFSMEPKWEEQGDLAAIECEFETDTVIANIGGYEKALLGGDFNSDYNNDFKTE